jgi:hypothetical protein
MGHSVGLTDPQLFGEHRATMQAEGPALARTALAEYLAELIGHVRSIGVGGAILILPSPDGAAHVPNVTGLRVVQAHERYRGELWNAGVLNSFEWLLHLRLAQLGTVIAIEHTAPQDGAEPTPPEPSNWIHTTGIPGLGRAHDVQLVDAERVARLTAIDGAVVTTGLLSPIMFGAKFANVDVSRLSPTVQAGISGRGMRHRSMAATVAAIAGASGVVVSQDGDVSAFSNHEGSMCYHPEDLVLETEMPSCCHASGPRVRHSHELLLEILSAEEAAKAAPPE